MVARPNAGSLGKVVKIAANVYSMQFESIVVYQYDVDIKPAAVPPRGGRGGGRGRGRGRGRGPPARAPPQSTEPIRLRAEIIDLVFKQLLNQNPFPAGAAFDGMKNLYIPHHKFPPIRRQVNVMIDDKRKTFDVAVTYAATINMDDLNRYFNGETKEYPSTATAALDVALRHVAALQRNVIAVGRSVFKFDNLAKLLSPGIQAWAGFSQSARPCQFGLMLNMNSCFTPMICEEDVAHFIGSFVSQRTHSNVPIEQAHRYLTPQLYEKMANKIIKLKAKTTHNPRKELYFKIAGFAEGTANSTRFDFKGRRISVAEYFQREYNIRIRYPDLRLVTYYKGVNVAKNQFPPEFVLIRKAPYKRPMSLVQKEKLIKAATIAPKDKRAYIDRCHQNQLNNPANEHHLQEWRLKIEKQMLRFPARVLPSPALEGGDQVFIDVDGRGEWEVTGYKFKLPIDVKSWAVVNFCDPVPPPLNGFLNQLVKMMTERGMTAPLPPLLNVQLGPQLRNMYNMDRILNQAKEVAQQKLNAPCQIILVILPEIDQKVGDEVITTENLYTEVKIASDQLVGVPSQCVSAENAGLIRPEGHNRNAYLANLTLKLNAKMGGINSILYNLPGDLPTFKFPKLEERPFIVLGADLTHPPPGAQDKRSIIGIVGSLDRHLSRYACRIQVQPPDQDTGREVIKNLQSAIKELLLAFYKNNNGCRPEAILFYRDGVSQGEFPKVLQYEYKAIRQACAEMGDPSAEYCPPITFVTCQKRHSMRLFPDDQNTDPSGNVLPGTVVDTHICHPHGFDFYLSSHVGIQGTSRCTLYSVLVDEVGFDADSLQLLTYWMCHLFCRCTKSVSYCPPAYFAHHAAARGKLLLCNQSRNARDPVHKDLVDELFFI